MRCLFNRKLYMTGQLARLQTASQSYDINYTQLYYNVWLTLYIAMNMIHHVKATVDTFMVEFTIQAYANNYLAIYLMKSCRLI